MGEATMEHINSKPSAGPNFGAGTVKEANWLPPRKVRFRLCMRLYSPRSDALTGKWNPPPVTKGEGRPARSAAPVAAAHLVIT